MFEHPFSNQLCDKVVQSISYSFFARELTHKFQLACINQVKIFTNALSSSVKTISEGFFIKRLRCGGIFNDFCIAIFLDISTVKECYESAIIWRIYVQSIWGLLFGPPCRCAKCARDVVTRLHWVVHCDVWRGFVFSLLPLLLSFCVWSDAFNQSINQSININQFISGISP